MIEWSQKLKLVPNIKWMGGPQGRLRKNLVTWIRFYSEIALKYWRPARDNWCKDGDSRGYTRTCGCKCVSPPYKKYLPAWGRLAAEFGDIKLQRDITNWLESQKVNYNSEVAFKYNVPMDQLSMTWYGYGTKVANYKDLSDSNSKSGWLSCAGKRAYCYLRDCPNNYWSSTTLCGDELFEIRKTNSVGSGGSGSGGRVVNGGRIFLQAGSNQFLNLYDCGDKHPMFLPPYPTTPVPGTNWWNTEPLGDWGFMSKPQALYISLPHKSGALLPPWDIIEELGKGKDRSQIPPRPNNPVVIESGDFVRLESEYSCTASDNVMDGWFEIVKTDKFLITNQWKTAPTLRLT